MQLEKLTQKELDTLYREQKLIDLPYLHSHIISGILLICLSLSFICPVIIIPIRLLPLDARIIMMVVGTVSCVFGIFNIFDYIHKLPEIKNTYKKACDTVDAIEKEIANRHIFYLHYRT